MTRQLAAPSSWSELALDLFVASGALTPEDAQTGVDESAATGRLATEVLARRGALESAKILAYFAGVTGLQTVDLSLDPPTPEALKAVPADLARRHHVVGYRLVDDLLVLAAAEPLNERVLEALEEGCGRRIGAELLADVLEVEALITELEPLDQPRAPGPASLRRAARDEANESAPGGERRVGVQVLAPHPLELDETLRRAAAAGASDVHLVSGAPPAMRVDGAIRPIEGAATIADEVLNAMLTGALGATRMAHFEEHGELDAAYALDGVGRFRVSVFRQRGSVGSVMRLIPGSIPTFEELGLPPSVASLAQLRRGLVLVTGPTGSGKSTTLASIVRLINESRPLHVVTIEDPIEFEHVNKTAIVNQREVGADTHSFADALRHVLRQDPDVILVGEMRDLESISIALTAAETGHLVLSTLHTPDAPQTIDRVIDAFPAAQQPQIRSQLASALEAVVAQQLLIGRSGTGRVAVAEVMRCTPAVRNLIRGGRTHQLASLIQSSGEAGMQTMDLGLARAVQAGLIAEAVAFDHAHDEDELRDYLKAGVGR